MIFKACVGKKNLKEDVEMRSAYAAGVWQPQKQAAVYCVRIDSVQNGNDLYREEKVPW